MLSWSGGKIPRTSTRGSASAAPRLSRRRRSSSTCSSATGPATSITYRVGLGVVAHGTRDPGARSLGKAALVVAVIGAALALAALFVGLYLWLRPPPVS